MSFGSWLWDNVGQYVWSAVDQLGNIITGKTKLSVDSVTKLVRDMVNSMLEAFANTLGDLQVAIEEAKFHLSQDIQKFYNTDIGFWVTIIGFAAAVTFVPTIVKWAAVQLAKIGFFKWLQGIELSVKSWKGWAEVNTLVEANRIAQILFKNWRTIWVGIYQDVSGIAADIGFGVGSLSSVITSVKALLVTMNTTMGSNEITAETDALTRMGGYLNGLANKFDHYAQHPQDIWNDLWENVILPKQGQVRAYYSKLASDIDKINTTIVKLEKLPTEFTNYQSNLQKLLGIQLTDKEKTIEASILKKVNNTINTYNTDIASKIDKIHTEVDPLNQAIIKHDKEIKANSNSLTNFLGGLGALTGAQSYEQMAAFLGSDTPTELGYLASDQATADIATFKKGIVLAVGISVGVVTEEQFNEYLNTDSGFKPNFATPLV